MDAAKHQRRAFLEQKVKDAVKIRDEAANLRDAKQNQPPHVCTKLSADAASARSAAGKAESELRAYDRANPLCDKECIAAFGRMHYPNECPKCFHCYRIHRIHVPHNGCQNCHNYDCPNHGELHGYHDHLCNVCGMDSHVTTFCRKEKPYCHHCYTENQPARIYYRHYYSDCKFLAEKIKAEAAASAAAEAEKIKAEAEAERAAKAAAKATAFAALSPEQQAAVKDEKKAKKKAYVARRKERDAAQNEAPAGARQIEADIARLRSENAQMREELTAGAPAASSGPINDPAIIATGPNINASLMQALSNSSVFIPEHMLPQLAHILM